jgi:hypothetical protein
LIKSGLQAAPAFEGSFVHRTDPYPCGQRLPGKEPHRLGRKVNWRNQSNRLRPIHRDPPSFFSATFGPVPGWRDILNSPKGHPISDRGTLGAGSQHTGPLILAFLKAQLTGSRTRSAPVSAVMNKGKLLAHQLVVPEKLDFSLSVKCIYRGGHFIAFSKQHPGIPATAVCFFKVWISDLAYNPPCKPTNLRHCRCSLSRS